jgi:hypothetical protein
MRQKFLLAVMALGLAGCVSHSLERRQAELAPLVGQSEADLVRRLGVPSRTIDADGRRFLAYRQQRADVLPGSGPFLVAPYHRFGYSGFGGFGGYDDFEGTSFPPTIIQHVCETTFEIAGGKVAGFSLRGDDC